MLLALAARATVPAQTDTIWFDDALPVNAGGIGADGGDTWNWISSNPTPFSGSTAHQSALASGEHRHWFGWSGQDLPIAAGQKLFVYVYLDPANPPREILLSWSTSSSWEHRAYWGENLINAGFNGTASRRYMGPLPAAGQWVRLEINASDVALEDQVATGMAFHLYDGRATFDKTGKASPPPPSSNDVIWFDDALPPNAGGVGADGGDTWDWVSSNPSPISGSLAHQSAVAAGEHRHWFGWSDQNLPLAAGDKLFLYVYLDPANPPRELLLSWSTNTSWEHRVYWGENLINVGVNGTASRYHAGALPAAGQWARLEVDASQLGLAGDTVTGVAFHLYDGRATFDKIGKATASSSGTAPTITTQPQSQNANLGATVTFTVAATGSSPLAYQWWKNGSALANATAATLTLSTVQASDAGNYHVVVSNSAGSVTSNTATLTIGSGSLQGSFARANYLDLALPQPGDETLNVLSPTVIELKRINTKEPDPARVDSWDFVNGNTATLQTGDFTVRIGGTPVAVTAVGFKRRPLYARASARDLRIENAIYLKLGTPIADHQSIAVTSTRFPQQFAGVADPLRFNPALHVNQEGYVSTLSKIARVGYYLGSLGELEVPSGTPFSIVDAQTGASVASGTLAPSPDVGWNDAYVPAPYQRVLKADFSGFTGVPGARYRLVVPGHGASLPFVIDDGVAMGFLRAIALGLYHQRCGAAIGFPHSRFTHGACHTAPAEVPVSRAAFPDTWNFIQDYNNAILGPESIHYPYGNTAPVNVSGGHHDAGDYSKYTINSAMLVSHLIFAVDAFPTGGRSDNLGLPESNDGIPDILQEAKWESDYLAKLQDSDGGFYAVVYPKLSKYEAGPPDRSNSAGTASAAQVVWPKSTSATAAAVAALAQIASSPTFRQHYPNVADGYLQKARAGWQFIQNAIGRFGPGNDQRYQKIYFYGDSFGDRDEIAWAACELFLATREQHFRTQLESWFPDPGHRMATYNDTWDPMFEGYGNAARSYAFAVQTGRVSSAETNAGYLTACRNRILLKPSDDPAGSLGTALMWSTQNAYGLSMPYQAKQHWGRVGYLHGLNRASDIAAAYALSPTTDKLTALIGNLDYEAGSNPVNATYITGIGRKRQREIVSQWFDSDDRALPGTGLTVAQVVEGYGVLPWYGGYSSPELANLGFPLDQFGNPANYYSIYDRWTDTWNVTAEGVTFRQAGALIAVCALAGQKPSYLSQPWRSGTANISGPNTVAVNQPASFTFSSPNIDPSTARIVWEGKGQEPAFGGTYILVPTTAGEHWVEVEAAAPDGRRVFARRTFVAQ